MKTILQAQGVQKTFGTKESIFPVLKDIEMKIEEGDFIGIMGPSGSGENNVVKYFVYDRFAYIGRRYDRWAAHQ